MLSKKRPLRDALRDTHIAVVVPAYRVAEQIERVVRKIPSFVRHIIVVDDCSPDDTIDRLTPFLSSRVRLVRHERNEGVGGAMLSGYAVALELGADIVVKVDGDDQMDPSQLPLLLRPIIRGKADYTKGNRFLHATALQQMPWMRRIGNFALTFLTKLASGYWNIFDPNNGYTAIHRRALSLLNTDRVAKGYFFETSILVELRRLQAVVMDVAIPARYGTETSSMSVRWVLLHFPIKLFGALMRRLGWQYFMHDFTAASMLLTMGVPLVLFGFGWGALTWYISISEGRVATTGTVLLSVLPLILGVEFLAQALVLDIAALPSRPVQRRILPRSASASHGRSPRRYSRKSESVQDERVHPAPKREAASGMTGGTTVGGQPWTVQQH